MPVRPRSGWLEHGNGETNSPLPTALPPSRQTVSWAERNVPGTTAFPDGPPSCRWPGIRVTDAQNCRSGERRSQGCRAAEDRRLSNRLIYKVVLERCPSSGAVRATGRMPPATDPALCLRFRQLACLQNNACFKAGRERERRTPRRDFQVGARKKCSFFCRNPGTWPKNLHL